MIVLGFVIELVIKLGCCCMLEGRGLSGDVLTVRFRKGAQRMERRDSAGISIIWIVGCNVIGFDRCSLLIQWRISLNPPCIIRYNPVCF